MCAAVKNVRLHNLLRHSEKPAAFAADIERLYGDVPRIELFARKRRRGWDYWGDGVG